jgi:hypothetical protein
MRHRARAIAAGLAVVFAIAMTGLLTAASPARAAEPIIIGSCATTVEGQPGQPISISPHAVMQPLVDIIRAVPVLGPPLAEPFRAQFAAMAPIPIGAVQNGNTLITGGTIANAVVATINRIPLLGPILGGIITNVQRALSAGCQVVVSVTNGVAAPVQDGTKGLADASQQAFGPRPDSPPNDPAPGSPPPNGSPGSPPQQGAPGATPPPNGPPLMGGMPFVHPLLAGWAYGRSPMADYSSIPFAKAGLFVPSPGVRYGGAVPGYSPQFGILGTDPSPGAVNAAGRADSLAAPAKSNSIELPILLAVLALSGVTATLVRTWVLRRTAV